MKSKFENVLSKITNAYIIILNKIFGFIFVYYFGAKFFDKKRIGAKFISTLYNDTYPIKS